MTIPTCWRRGAFVAVLGLGGSLVGLSSAHADPTGVLSTFTALSGQGTGLVKVSPNASEHGIFEAHVVVNLHDTTPNTTFTITRAVDFVPDGICTSTDFGGPASLDTSAGGAGAVTFVRGGVPSGTMFDLILRATAPDGTVLESGCMTVTAK